MIRYINKIIIFVILLFSIFIFDGLIESNDINKDIDMFKTRGELVLSIDNCNYYQVKPIYSYENSSNIINDCKEKNIGTTGDIYITDRNPINNFFITKWLSKLTWIGHCGIIYDEYGYIMADVVGNKDKKSNVVKTDDNKWFDIDSSRSVVMRVKNINYEQKENIKKEIDNLKGCKYNYSFIFSSNKCFYCSDLITYIYKMNNINLNCDYFVTTGADIINNDNTYIIYYKEKVQTYSETYYNIYYLTEEIK